LDLSVVDRPIKINLAGPALPDKLFFEISKFEGAGLLLGTTRHGEKAVVSRLYHKGRIEH
jgi:hypothetical protein